ncbi:hypothetical protein ACWGDX_03185 [Streptomyces sp. NPDC055025]
MRRSIGAVMLALAAAITLAPVAAAEEPPPPITVPGDLGWGTEPADVQDAVQGDLGWG